MISLSIKLIFEKIFLFIVLMSPLLVFTQTKEQEVIPITINASSFYKGHIAKFNNKYEKYRKYFENSSPESVIDKNEFSSWTPDSDESIDEWITLNFEYPITPSSIKILTGCHIDDFLFNLNKRVKKVEISNEYGEKEKYTFTDTKTYNKFTLEFKKAFKKLKIKILKVENIKRSNEKFTVGFTEISVFEKRLNNDKLAGKIKLNQLKDFKKEVKNYLKVADNPNLIRTKDYTLIEYALLSNKKEFVKFLWKKKFRFYNASDKLIREFTDLDQALNYSEHIASVNKDYNSLKEKLNNDNVVYSWRGIDSIKSILDYRYNIILKEEKHDIPKLIERKKVLYANKKLLDKKVNIDNISNTFIGLNELNNFKNENDLLFTHASLEIKEDITQYLSDKKTIILKTLANQEKTAFLSKHLTINNIKDVNYYINYHSKKFEKYKDHTEVNNLLDFLKSYKSTLLSENYKLLFSDIIKMRRKSQLDEFTEIFLSNTKKTSQIEIFENLIKARRKVIEKVNNILKENWQKEKELRDIKINQYKSVVVSQRKTLEKKYNVILPKIEDLHTALYYFTTLINSSGKYNKNDAYKFINYIQGKGYIRKLKNNIYDIEFFKNHKGYSINCASIKDDNSGRISHSVTFEVLNAPKDLYNLYAKEIVSYYKNLEKGDYDPNKNPEGSLFYESGNTIYQIEYKPNKTLRVIAINNDDFEYDLPAERISFNSFKIDSRPSFVYLYINKGDIIDFSVYGNIKLGFFAGYSSPSGISGYTIYNRVRGFKHGALLGKIGKKGDWFLIGEKTRIKAEETGTLYVTINDKKINDNDGYYTLTYNKY